MKREYEQLLFELEQLRPSRDNLHQLLENILSQILNTLGCDRAWCLYPCDPEAEEWEVPIEITRVGWGGVYNSGLKMPTLPVEAEIFRIHLDSQSPITYGRGADYPMPEHAENIFMIKSQISTAVIPSHGKPWVLGVHFCEDHHLFTDEEIGFFTQLGKKVGDVFADISFPALVAENNLSFSS